MQNIISTYKEYKKFSDNSINISIHYIIFLISIFLVHNPSYINLINAESWVPINIQSILLGVFDLIYSNIYFVLIVLVTLFTLIYLFDKINFFNKFLPNEENFTDGTKVSWNQISALNRIIRCGIILITTLWIYYFTINILFNFGNYVEKFYVANTDDFIGTEQYSIHSLLMQCFYYLNVFLLIYFITRSLFQIKIPINKYILTNNDLSYYIKINHYSCAPSTNKESRIIILKDKYMKKPNYYLVEEHTKRHNNININPTGRATTPLLSRPHIKSYKVINVSKDLNEIIYHFDQLVLRLER